MTTHLVIPDSHAHPDHDNTRYDLLARLTNELRPDVVVDIGDWFDMASLCSYDKGTKSFEGRRYAKDIEAGLEAQERYYDGVRRAKRRLPRFVRTLGNHEHRIVRAVEQSPILEGVISTRDLQSREYGWEEHPFLEPVEIDGIRYAHYFTTGVMNRPIGGEHTAYSMLMKEHRSCVQGHSHLYDHCIRSSGDSFIHGVNVGCFFDYQAEWAGAANRLYHRGVCILHDVDNGHFDTEWVSLKRLERLYGDI